MSVQETPALEVVNIARSALLALLVAVLEHRGGTVGGPGRPSHHPGLEGRGTDWSSGCSNLLIFPEPCHCLLEEMHSAGAWYSR